MKFMNKDHWADIWRANMNSALRRLEARYHRALRRVPEWLHLVVSLSLLAWLFYIIGCGLMLGYVPGLTQ